MVFCHKCGYELPNDSEFCSKCGVKILKSVQDTHPLEKIQDKESGYKLQMVIGAIILLGGVATSNGYSIFLGVSLFIVGFVSLKTKSKTIKQLMKYISWIVIGIAIINLANSLLKLPEILNS